jgi:hypothetical protein
MVQLPDFFLAAIKMKMPVTTLAVLLNQLGQKPSCKSY